MNKFQSLLITGGAGFIGSNFIRMLLSENQDNLRIINLDALTYAGNPENLSGLENDPRYIFVKGRIEDTALVLDICRQYKVDGIINFAAESHVDRSIQDARPFVETNITGTISLLNVAKELGISRFVQVSTDEVYGSLGPDPSEKFTENTPLAPNSPYSAAKASADCFVRAFAHTHHIPAIITRCSNNYGPRQFPEKLIPLMILNAHQDKQLPVYGDGMNIRDWIHVQDHCRAVWLAYQHGIPGEVYNIGADSEYANITIVKTVLALLGKPESLITYVKDRPGHDRRYAIDASKAHKELGWKPLISFSEGLRQTVEWYIANPGWCSRVLNGEYMSYYEKQYQQ
jgi:dTDP-glucose 4,6-dehydratase